MQLEVINVMGRTFGPDGDSIGYEEFPVTVLKGVTLNGSYIMPEDFDRDGRIPLVG